MQLPPLPEEYRTGTPHLDAKIAQALLKDPFHRKKVSPLLTVKTSLSKPLITVGEKDARTYKDGTLFASVGEMQRWDYLLHMQQAKQITHLARQIEFILVDGVKHPQWGEVNPVIYVADFVYTNISLHKDYPAGSKVVEDHKGGYLTPIYKLKRRLFLARYPHLLFFEVTA